MPKYSVNAGFGKEMVKKLNAVKDGEAISLPSLFPGMGVETTAFITKYVSRNQGDYWELRFEFEGIPFATGTVHVLGSDLLMETT